MSDFKHFDQLGKMYLPHGVTTAEDIEELFDLLRTDDFDHAEREMFKKIWDEDVPPSPEDEAIKERIFNNIIASFSTEAPIRTPYTVWPWLAAAAILVFVMIKLLTHGASMYETYLYEAGAAEAAASKNSIRCFAGPFYVKLPDNSTVELKRGSVLRYNRTTYGTKNRELLLTGTAFFDVTPNADLPFKVRCGRITTTVLGTAFNVSDTNQTVEVTVVRGKVTVGDSIAAVSTLYPHEKITISANTMTFITRKTNMAADLQWRKNHLVFEDIPIHEAMDRIEERFKVTITITNPLLRNCRISAGFFHDESLREIMDQISATQGATAVVDGNNIRIEGGKGCGNIQKF
jgi:transmembrane sensor